MNDELIFYPNPLSRGSIVHWMLEEAGCRYVTQVVDFDSSMKSPDYLAINPMGKVPAIRHGGQVVTEAAAICVYLAEAFPGAGLLPAAADRGAYYRWLFFAAACLEPAYVNRASGWNPTTAEMRRSFGYGSYEQVLDTLSGLLHGRTYVAGDRFSTADLYLASHLRWGMMTGAIDKRPEFEAYRDAHINRPAALRALTKAQAL
jgi:glutathione S-transferase